MTSTILRRARTYIAETIWNFASWLYLTDVLSRDVVTVTHRVLAHKGRCFEGGCECTPRVFVAVDVLLSHDALKAAVEKWRETSRMDEIIQAAIDVVLLGETR